MSDRQSQCNRILDLLRTREWIPLPMILDLRIACHTKRISELREQGHVIECETTWVEGTRHSRYRLIVQPKQLELLSA